MRTFPVFKKIKELIEQNKLGNIRRINWTITNWFRTQSYYNSGGWRGNWTGEGGGVLINQCPHILDLFQWFFGLPRKIVGLSYLGKWHDITVEDEISVLMEMENGAPASFITTTGETPGTNRLEIIGEKGKLVYEEGENLVYYKLDRPMKEIIDHEKQAFYVSNPQKEIIDIPDIEKGHRVITQNTLDVILGKTSENKLISPGVDGVKSLQLANSMLYAGIQRKQIDFPVAEEKFQQLLSNLKKDERKNHSDKVFDWMDWLKTLS
jgi:predicted dehydrogenase